MQVFNVLFDFGHENGALGIRLDKHNPDQDVASKTLAANDDVVLFVGEVAVC